MKCCSGAILFSYSICNLLQCHRADHYRIAVSLQKPKAFLISSYLIMFVVCLILGLAVSCRLPLGSRQESVRYKQHRVSSGEANIVLNW